MSIVKVIMEGMKISIIDQACLRRVSLLMMWDNQQLRVFIRILMASYIGHHRDDHLYFQ
jgi:hypothetical protein